MMAHTRAIFTLLLIITVVVSDFVNCERTNADLEKELRVLSKQVQSLVAGRTQDLKVIQENLEKKLYDNEELAVVHNELKNLRDEMELLRITNPSSDLQLPNIPANIHEKNDRLTLKWLMNTLTEMKTELVEIQSTINSTVAFQNNEQMHAEMQLLKSDVLNLNQQLELSKSRNAKYEAELLESREELASIKDDVRANSVVCGKTKNQLKAVQLEWNHNWKILNEKQSTTINDIELPKGISNLPPHALRHQRLLKKHILSLEKSSKLLHKETEALRTRMLKMEEEMSLLQNYYQSKDNSNDIYDRINGNNIQDYVRMHKIREITADRHFTETVDNITREQEKNSEAIFNLTRQLGNFDKLHLSMLELLEDVESIESKVDKTVPEFRKEISKLEIQIAEATSSIAQLKEVQTNTRNSVKAISVSVSNLQQLTETDHKSLESLNETMDNLIVSNSLQTSKLHDHILKSESSTLDLNQTKATIHLEQELKSFEKEYKSIVNKLPHDCGSVNGPSGIYLISPGDGEPILAYCEHGWTVIQKRKDGSVDFNRNWNEYSNGFGSATGEHWLGNRNLHYLTKDNCSQLQINLKDIYGKYWQANYEEFYVADFSQGFRLSVDKYSGNASDALDYQNRMEFSTVDNDRDISNTHCASNYEGGWWFSHCQHANLNGRYNLGLTWFDSARNEWIAVSKSEMRVRRKDNC